MSLVREDLAGTVRTLNNVFRHIDTLIEREGCGRRLYFRGHADVSWGVQPTIARTFTFGGKRVEGFSSRQEIALLHRFRRRAYGHYQGTLPQWEATFLARHHGLPVRLLDWTMNPLVALYFACTFAEKPETDGAVWVLVPRPGRGREYIDVLDPKGHEDPLGVKGVRFIYPHDVSPRITLQSGIFTIQDYPEIRDLSAPDLIVPDEHNDVAFLTKWTVPRRAKQSLLLALDRAAINRRTLLADLDGIGQGLWESEVLRYGAAVQLGKARAARAV